jgi:hypothetical protein
MALRKRGNLLSASIEPETSSRKTRFAGGRSSWATGVEARPMRSNRPPSVQGERVRFVVTENGCSSSGAGY